MPRAQRKPRKPKIIAPLIPPVPVVKPLPPLRHRTPGQAAYLSALRNQAYQLLIATGPAGTGKTFLAMAVALQHLHAGNISRIVLVRPTVTCGAGFGFLPGDERAKLDPHFFPLFDAVSTYLGDETGKVIERLIADEKVVVAPLQFMRGCTLRRACVILDEGQNVTEPQMKMFLTRIGEGTRAVITGDLRQTDLPPHVPNGLARAVKLRSALIGHVAMTAADIVRSELVRVVEEQW